MQSSISIDINEDPYPWILSPLLDLLFCCGGFLFILLLIILCSGLTNESNMNTSALGQSLLLLNFLGQILIASSHQPATLWRIFTSKNTWNNVGRFSFCTALVFISLGMLGLFNPSITGILVRITFVWSIQHTLAQAYGVSLIYCLKRKYQLSVIERNIFHAVFQTAFVYLALRMFTYPQFMQRDLYGLILPVCNFLPEWICILSLQIFQLSVVIFSLMVFRKYIKEKKLIPFPSLICASMAIATLEYVYLFPSMFLIFIPTFYHASQYLVVTTAFYLKESVLSKNKFSPKKIANLLKSEYILNYFVIIFALGSIFYVGLPRLLYEMGFNQSLCLCVVYCIFNLHHYVTDAAIWKIRDPYVRKLLIA